MSIVDTLPQDAGAPLTRKDLVGTYKLTKILREIVATGELFDMTGENGAGYIMYGSDGRMMVLINHDGRSKADKVEDLTDADRLKLFGTTIAYGGTYNVEGNKVTHNILISWNDVWTGMNVIREIRRDGDRLIYIAPAAPASDTGEIICTVLIWKKV